MRAPVSSIAEPPTPAPRPSGIAPGLYAGLVAGLTIAAVDSAFALTRAWPSPIDVLVGLGAIFVVCHTLGLAVAVVAAATLRGWGDGVWQAGARETLAALRRSWVRPGTPDDEARHLAWLSTMALTAAALAAAIAGIAPVAATDVPRDAAPFLRMALALSAVAAVILWLAPAWAHAMTGILSRATHRWPRLVTLRTLAALTLLAAGLVLWGGRGRVTAFLRALDLGPFIALACGSTAGLLALSCPRFGVRLRPAIAILVLLPGVGWPILSSTLGDRPGALTLYRGRAPITGGVMSVVTAWLDHDGDGRSAYFGDGDCAPTDPDIGPQAREIPGNGIDEDCFDGDLILGADGRPPTPALVPDTIPDGLSFLVIQVDAVRPDHLGHNGHTRPTSPVLDALAARSVVFERAYAPSAYTYASVPALLTSKYPMMLPTKVLEKRGRIRETDRTLAEHFGAAGWRTAMATDGVALGRTGLDRGFELRRAAFDDAKRTTGHALALLDELGDARFFLWVDYLTPHAPYTRHPGAPDFGPELRDLYDHELRAVDRQLGALFDGLDERGLSDRVVIVVLADHGEAFGEHGTYYHGHHLHEESVRVPLIVHVPGVAPRRLGRAPVSLLDVAPTLLNLARLPIPEDFMGHDLTAALTTGAENPAREVFMESMFVGYGLKAAYQAALVIGDEKLIDDQRSRTLSLYDLRLDPGERDDLAARRPDRVRALLRRLKRHQAYGAPR